ncbi:MAG: prephenate dehydratase [Lachnospiraceae bacterium]|jgi:chorismate mutase/prephenate dehydratase|nr:prephenate dehydratase [Lachnospiraceae bacterium]
MDELDGYRRQIDEIDKSITDLYKKRLQVSEKVAEYKIREHRKVLDPAREKQKLLSVEAMADDEFTRLGIRELFEQIMAVSRKKQYRLLTEQGIAERLPFIPADSLFGDGCRVVFQGDRGSYSEEATRRFFGEKVESRAVPTFRDAMTSIEEGMADYAVLPIENSTAGVVSQNYDLLEEYENYIVGEEIIPIAHCLLGCEGASEETVKCIYSHAQSLMQCDRYLESHPQWQTIAMQNNAFAARKVAEDRDPGEGAIAGEYCAGVYGLKVLARGISTSVTNSTRFVVCTNQKIFLKGADKISIIVEIPHVSGSLYRILSHFIYNGLNMTKIESRPIEERNWEYRFFIDFEGSLSDEGVRNALRGLRDDSRKLKILGNYKKAENH